MEEMNHKGGPKYKLSQYPNYENQNQPANRLQAGIYFCKKKTEKKNNHRFSYGLILKLTIFPLYPPLGTEHMSAPL